MCVSAYKCTCLFINFVTFNSGRDKNISDIIKPFLSIVFRVDRGKGSCTI